VLEHEIPMTLSEAQEGIVGGHYVGRETTQNILCVGIWWSTLHKDDKEYYQACDVCQRVGNPYRRDGMHFYPKFTL
jgi:ABC-type antimicrobial peptide transport system ATPase subunit